MNENTPFLTTIIAAITGVLASITTWGLGRKQLKQTADATYRLQLSADEQEFRETILKELAKAHAERIECETRVNMLSKQNLNQQAQLNEIRLQLNQLIADAKRIAAAKAPKPPKAK